MPVTTVVSAPFTPAGTTTSVVLTIPWGTYLSGLWSAAGGSSVGSITNYVKTPSEVSNNVSPGGHGATGWVEPAVTAPPTGPTPCSLVQISDINAAGGSTITVTWVGASGETSVVLTLTLTPQTPTQAVSPGYIGGAPGGDNVSGLSGNPYTFSGTTIAEITSDALALRARVHRQATRQQNGIELWYMDRSNTTWYLFPTQPVFSTKEGPTRKVAYNQPTTCEFYLVDPKGLLTRQNMESSYNYNHASDYDPILDEARPVVLRAGAWCFANLLTGGATVTTATDGSASYSGALSLLTDGLLNNFATGTGNALIITTGTSTYFDVLVDIGSSQTVQHVVARFGSRLGTTVLPIALTVSYSADAITYNQLNSRPVGGPGGASTTPGDWDENYSGIAVEVAQTDIEATARYWRFRITLPASGTTAIDEIAIYGGGSQSLIGRNRFAGYLGDQIEVDAFGKIKVRATDVCKRLYDNTSNPLTANYFVGTTGVVELADIAYSLLTSTAYWRVAAGAYNAPFTSAFVGWATGVGYTGFGLPVWQGQTNSMWGYLLELWRAIGWRFYADGSGILNARDTVYMQTTPDRVFIAAPDGNNDVRQCKRHITGTDLRNVCVVDSSQALDLGAGTVRISEMNSVNRYGERLFKISDPMAITPQIREQIAQYALHDYAWATETLSAEIAPDFDTALRQIHAFRAGARPSLYAKACAYVGKRRARELWCCQTLTETIGVGEWWGIAEYKSYVPLSTLPPNFTSIAPGTPSGGSAPVVLHWDALTDPKVAFIKVYKSSTSDFGPWTVVSSTVSAAATTYTDTDSISLTFWYFVTTVDAFGIESFPSTILSVQPGTSGMTYNADYYVSDLAVGYVGVTGPDAHGVYTYQFYATWTSPSNGGFTPYFADAATRNPAGAAWAMNMYLWQIFVAKWWARQRIPPGKKWDRVTAGQLDAQWYVRTTQNLSGLGLHLYFRLWNSPTTNGPFHLGVASNSVNVSIP